MRPPATMAHTQAERRGEERPTSVLQRWFQMPFVQVRQEPSDTKLSTRARSAVKWARIAAVAAVALLLLLALIHEVIVSSYQCLPFPFCCSRSVLQVVYLMWTVIIGIDY